MPFEGLAGGYMEPAPCRKLVIGQYHVRRMTIAILRGQLLRDKRLVLSVKVTPKSSRNEK